jgi:hypothetical protein
LENTNKATAKLQWAHNEPQKTLSELQDTIRRLELDNPALPLCIPVRSSDCRGREQPLTSLTSKTKFSHLLFSDGQFRSEAPQSPRLLDNMSTSLLTLAPRDFFKSLIAKSFPTFNFSTYDVILDPVYPYHLHITLDSSNDVKVLIAM